MPFQWLFLSFSPQSPQELTETNAILLFPTPHPRVFFFLMLTKRERKEGKPRKEAAVYRGVTRRFPRHAAKERWMAEVQPHSTCPDVWPGLGPHAQRRGGPRSCQHHCSFPLSSLCLRFSSTLAKNLYEVSCHLCFSLRKS